jgi:hypothetical protein
MNRSANANANANLPATDNWQPETGNWRLTMKLTKLTNFSPFRRVLPVFPPFCDRFAVVVFAAIFAIRYL